MCGCCKKALKEAQGLIEEAREKQWASYKPGNDSPDSLLFLGRTEGLDQAWTILWNCINRKDAAALAAEALEG